MIGKLYFVTAVIFGLLNTSAVSTLAQSSAKQHRETSKVIGTISFKPPPEDQEPDKTTGAGSRGGSCPQDAFDVSVPLQALVPKNNRGLTVAERPTFWIYLPKTSAKQMVLSIREQGSSHHSQVFLPVPPSSGIIGIQAPLHSQALEVGKNYQWAVVLVCAERPSPNDPAIASWVRRVAPSATNQEKTPLGQAIWYGEQGIWYDALSSLVEARRTQSDNQTLIDAWTGFLAGVGLETVAREPLQF